MSGINFMGVCYIKGKPCKNYLRSMPTACFDNHKTVKLQCLYSIGIKECKLFQTFPPGRLHQNWCSYFLLNLNFNCHQNRKNNYHWPPIKMKKSEKEKTGQGHWHLTKSLIIRDLLLWLNSLLLKPCHKKQEIF